MVLNNPRMKTGVFDMKFWFENVEFFTLDVERLIPKITLVIKFAPIKKSKIFEKT